MSELEWPPVLKGALLAGVIGAICGGLEKVVPEHSSLIGLLLLAILAGMALGGYLAGTPQPELALTAGAFAGLISGAVLQLVNLGAAIRNDTLGLRPIILMILLTLICASAGSLGGYVAFRRSAMGQE